MRFSSDLCPYCVLIWGWPWVPCASCSFLDLEDASSVLPLLKTLSHTNSTIGLQGNVIFDSVTDARAPHFDGPLPIFQEFEVGATVFHVDCSLLPDASQSGHGSFNEWNITTPVPDGNITTPTVPMRLLCGFLSSEIILSPSIHLCSLADPYGIRFLPVAPEVQSNLVSLTLRSLHCSNSDVETLSTCGQIGQPMILYASLNVTDDQGQNGTHLELDPPMACESILLLDFVLGP